ncbi:DUF547 domain-containing protein [Robiginitalea aurantiaca]|uniref:DUF547 domain-containing protein n=1 Tax=Robiginitalea aurantiaca TaxID=3056915 RepID=A0ABT7WEZ5_9FLAO|nr:DUF547 domain-containing protein [Robiginitalea aurantiaca]MDM9631448.1 DUF547 domain-containing protein [Robiginitalea aurantiaca]
MNRCIHILALVLIFGSLHAQSGRMKGDTDISPYLHASWDSLLKAHVSNDGMVNYKGFLEDRESLRSYLSELSETPPQPNWTREARLAYFINLYNAGTIAMILENYPVKSIRDIKRPWGRKWIQVGEDLYSLGDIEHKILRKMEDPRIHFAINCASFSCPPLPKQAFTEAEVESQLEGVTRAFINDPQRNVICPEKAQVSKIFKWFRADFESAGVSLLDYLNRYTDKRLKPSTPIEFLPYDWSLNESVQ